MEKLQLASDSRQPNHNISQLYVGEKETSLRFYI